MKFLKKMFTKKEKGFTLVELLVVIGIMGLLAAVTVPTFTHFLSNGKKASAEDELQNVQTAVTAMMTEQGLVAIAQAADTTATQDMTNFPSAEGNDHDGAQVLYGSTYTDPETNYIKKMYTKYYYVCDTEGDVTGYYDSAKTEQISPPPTATPTPES